MRHPRVISSAELDTFFGVAIDFGAEADELSFSAGARDLPVVSADRYLNEALVSYWEAALAQHRGGHSPIRAAVENATLPLLPHGKARISTVAEALRVSSQTLARRLAAEDLTFAQVLARLVFTISGQSRAFTALRLIDLVTAVHSHLNELATLEFGLQQLARLE